jgi:hypothetical protein
VLILAFNFFREIFVDTNRLESKDFKFRDSHRAFEFYKLCLGSPRVLEGEMWNVCKILWNVGEIMKSWSRDLALVIECNQIWRSLWLLTIQPVSVLALCRKVVMTLVFGFYEFMGTSPSRS